MNPAIPKATMGYQAMVLAERYLDVFLSDFTSLFFLVFQPITVAVCIGLVWQGTANTPTLHFVLVFSAMFFGCVNACREIVKEKAIYSRERLVGLQLWPYLLSKWLILSLFGLGQTLLFYFSVRFYLVIDGSPLLLLVSLYLSLLAGTALGLAISAFVTSDVMALALVPVFLIPQLLFSKLVMPNRTLTGIVQWMEHLTLVKWSYQAIEQAVASSPDLKNLIQGWLVLTVMMAALLLLSSVLMLLKEKLR